MTEVDKSMIQMAIDHHRLVDAITLMNGWLEGGKEPTILESFHDDDINHLLNSLHHSIKKLKAKLTN